MKQPGPHINPIRIVIVNDHPERQTSSKKLLELIPGIEVVGCASHGIEALKLCDELAPDLLLMDLTTPVCDGVIGSRLIKDSFPEIKVLMMIGMGDKEKLTYAFLSHADGFLLLPFETKKIIIAIKCVIAGIHVNDKEVYIP